MEKQYFIYQTYANIQPKPKITDIVLALTTKPKKVVRN